MKNASFLAASSKILWFGFLVSISRTFAAETVIVTDITATKLTGELESWSAETIRVSSIASRDVDLNDVRSIEFDRKLPQKSQIDSQVWLSNGDRISARLVNVSEDALTISWPLLRSTDPLTIPLERVVALIFEVPATMSAQLRLFADLETLPPGSDIVMLANGDRTFGELVRLDAALVELKGVKSSLKLDRSRVRAIRLNPELTNAGRMTGRRAVIALTDRSRITASHVELTDQGLQVKSLGLGIVTLPLTVVRSCHFYGGRVIPVTDYEPPKVEFTPYLSAIWPLVRNANVMHGPLRLRGTDYATGLGMHSRMSATYELRGNEREFQSFVGIDDAANGSGNAVFAVEVDGRRVWSSTDLTGKSPVAIVPAIDLQGAKKLALIVEFGQFGDVSDYANWCDAVLILSPRR